MRVRLPVEGYSQNPFVFSASRSVRFVDVFHAHGGYIAHIAIFEAEILVGPQERYYPGFDVAGFEKSAFMALKSRLKSASEASTQVF